jgi:hypothetical protein
MGCRSLLLILTLICGSATLSAAETADPLAAGFDAPPQNARLRAYWWWLNSHVTKAAITRDLEWMQKIGMGGGLLFDAGGPAGPTPYGPLYGSPQWRELFRHALHEADRLGLELTLNPQSGWNLGGPGVQPDLAGKRIVWSQMQVTGPKKVAAELPVPRHTLNYYRDSFVVAYRLKDGASVQPAGPVPRRASEKRGAKQPPGAQTEQLPDSSRHRPIRDLADKAVFHELGGNAPDCSSLLEDVLAEAGEEDVAAKDVINLSDHFKEGVLTWEAPAGRWQIIRFGYSNNGGRVSTSSGKWQGLVIDYLDAAALRSYWSEVVEPLIADAGPLAGRVLRGLQTDSWEGGGLNWTARMPEEFRKRRGYEIWPYLPVVAGAIVENRDASNRFLADLRKTIGDCFADNHYAVMQELAAKHAMYIHCEAGGPHAGPFDALNNWSSCEMPMGEFWVYSPHRPTDESRFFMKGAASSAHIFGRKIACGEGFTSIGPHWNDILWSSQKPTFDHEACAGLNLTYWHAFTCSPPESGPPGQEYFAGTHFDPSITWARQAPAFVAYMNRCHFLLQQGQFVADVCYYNGDNVPNLVGRKQADPAGILPGYDYDVINERVLLERVHARDGRIEVAGGMSYRILVLPNLKTMSLAALKKIRQLVAAGAVVVGPKPQHTMTLQNYPACDQEFRQIADELWDHFLVVADGARQVLAERKILPDFTADEPAGLDYIHRRDGKTEIYFVRNQHSVAVSVRAIFRVAGLQPELWDPMSGTHRDARAFRQEGKLTTVPLEFGPYGSIFVIFRRPAAGNREGHNFPRYVVAGEVNGPWTVSFDPKWGGPASVPFDTLVSWTSRKEEGIRYYSGTATYRTEFGRPAGNGRLAIDLGRVANLAEVRLNGKNLGVIWAPPFRVEITDAVKDRGNQLEVDVVNTWYNRLILDQTLPAEQRLTRTNVQLPKDSKPQESGLLGPVRIMRIEE